MEILLQARDVFQFAIRIEEDGEEFYRKAALVMKDEGAKKLFNRLADDEIKHKKTFQGMLSKTGDHTPSETYEGEYLAYLHDYIDNKAVFTKDTKGRKASEVKDSLSAIAFAMQRELDSILYYQEIKHFIAAKHHGAIEKIIAEERRHFAKLMEVRRSYL